MPVRETVLNGREFLDQFGKENNGWRAMSHSEESEFDLSQSLPQSLLIPEVTDSKIKKMGEYLRPAHPVELSAVVYLQHLPGEPHPRDHSYTWNKPEISEEPIGVANRKTTLHTLHTFGYPLLFKPSIAEVFGAIKRAGYQHADGREYFWTEPSSDRATEAVWPNVPVEVYTGGEHHIIFQGSYHLGQTALYQLMPDDQYTRNFLEEFPKLIPAANHEVV